MTAASHVLAQIIGVPLDDLVQRTRRSRERHGDRHLQGQIPRALPARISGGAPSRPRNGALRQIAFDWLKGAAGDDAGPYLIAHLDFTPAFKILAHKDEPQIPWGVIRLEFRDERAVFDSIAPRGAQSTTRRCRTDSKLHEQNCFRCHNNGAEGGLKSGVTWTVLAVLAANSPQFFTEYVRDPKAKNPKTGMAASPDYDDATMRALIAYFRTFAPIPPEAR